MAEPPVSLGALQFTVRETGVTATVPMVGAPSGSCWAAGPLLHGALDRLVHVRLDAQRPPGCPSLLATRGVMSGTPSANRSRKGWVTKAGAPRI